MPTCYQYLRQAVAHLAAGADTQHAHLESILGHLTPDGDASGYGNDELALELDDFYHAANHMHEWGEISREEIEAIRPLDAMLRTLSGKAHADFWRREALWSDPRWEQVRALARRALAQLPDEERRSSWQPGAD
ncbi:hypothetical protein FHR20_002044 [Sphingomonas leidyi]|uniref:Uncharacterized protein n=1 Tax=Sphingomonas leidyi TaxID=68569 RepID=A0A7X5ZVF4_9SPHN|nr:hypothetical protein [Sphingomonas leidyi]NIJ65082.1 hypothetical protein [Sphingomonas leidyi]